MRGIRTTQDILDRCRVDEETGCWLWGMAFSNGTKRSTIPYAYYHRAGRSISVMRIVAYLRSGDESYLAANKLMVWRTCRDNRCVRHLQWGTREDFGDWVRESGHKKGLAKTIIANTRARRDQSVLSMDDVRAIRSSSDSCRDAGIKHGISATQVSRIRRGVNWSDHGPASVFNPRTVCRY